MVEYRTTSPDYFLDRMDTYEAELFIDYLPYIDKTSWEQTRQIVRATFQIMSKKQLKISDILTMPWDTEAENHDVDKEQMERVKALAKSLEGKINLN